MPKYSMTLEEQLSDARSNEVAYRLRIENFGESPIDILNINPRIPEDVDLIEVKDLSSEAVKLKHKKICTELTELLEEQLFVTSKDYRERIVVIEKEYIQEMLKDFNAVPRIYFGMFTGYLQKQMQRKRERSDAGKFIIDSKRDANIALEKWFFDEDTNEARSTIFRAKFAQLEELDEQLGAEASASAIATIESDSFFATTYVLRFPRSGLNPRKFSFAVEAAITETGTPKQQLGAVSTTVIISPQPYVLSGIAMTSALLGSTVKYAITTGSATDVPEYFTKLSVHLITSPGLSSIILALLLFNVYEYTELGNNIKMRVGWRSALLIGVVSGLFSDRIIESLKVLFGA